MYLRLLYRTVPYPRLKGLKNYIVDQDFKETEHTHTKASKPGLRKARGGPSDSQRMIDVGHKYGPSRARQGDDRLASPGSPVFSSPYNWAFLSPLPPFLTPVFYFPLGGGGGPLIHNLG